MGTYYGYVDGTSDFHGHSLSIYKTNSYKVHRVAALHRVGERGVYRNVAQCETMRSKCVPLEVVATALTVSS